MHRIEVENVHQVWLKIRTFYSKHPKVTWEKVLLRESFILKLLVFSSFNNTKFLPRLLCQRIVQHAEKEYRKNTLEDPSGKHDATTRVLTEAATTAISVMRRSPRSIIRVTSRIPTCSRRTARHISY